MLRLEQLSLVVNSSNLLSSSVTACKLSLVQSAEMSTSFTLKIPSTGQLLSLVLVCAFPMSDPLIGRQMFIGLPISVAAGLRCTLANNAYNASELSFQYIDSGAKVVYTTPEGLPVVRQTFQELGLSKAEADKRILILPESLKWAGGPDAPRHPDTIGLFELDDLLDKGALRREERFDGNDANETAYLCYSSGNALDH